MDHMDHSNAVLSYLKLVHNRAVLHTTVKDNSKLAVYFMVAFNACITQKHSIKPAQLCEDTIESSLVPPGGNRGLGTRLIESALKYRINN